LSQLEHATREAHRATVQSTTQDVAAYVQEVLGQKLVAYIVDADPKTVGRWTTGTKPRSEAEARLRAVHMILRLLLTEESPHTVRAWFVGLNPQLDDESPAGAIREGRDRDALVAAKSFLAGG
jgi:hypothetical protein